MPIQDGPCFWGAHQNAQMPDWSMNAVKSEICQIHHMRLETEDDTEIRNADIHREIDRQNFQIISGQINSEDI